MRWFGTITTLVLFLALIANQDLGRLWVAVKGISVKILILSLGCYFAGLFFNAVRWHVLLGAGGIVIDPAKTLKIVFLGAYASNFLPTTVGGDIIRIFSLMALGAGRASVVASVVMDRLTNVVAMLTVLPLSFTTMGPTILQLGKQSTAQAMVLGAHQPETAPPQRETWKTRIIDLFHNISDAFKRYLAQPRALVLCFLLSWLAMLSVFSGIWLICRGLGIPVSFNQVMGVTAITYLLTLFPISINGYGLRELAVTTLYAPLGASLEQGAALALLTRLMMLLISLPGALSQSQVMSEIRRSGPPS